jgi:hypothetical protein
MWIATLLALPETSLFAGRTPERSRNPEEDKVENERRFWFGREISSLVL